MLWYVLEMYKQGIMLLRATSARPIDLILSPPVNLPFLGFVIGGQKNLVQVTIPCICICMD
jgi:hypothetical protein